MNNTIRCRETGRGIAIKVDGGQCVCPPNECLMKEEWEAAQYLSGGRLTIKLCDESEEIVLESYSYTLLEHFFLLSNRLLIVERCCLEPTAQQSKKSPTP